MATKAKAAWVCIGGKPGEIGYCSRCGQGLEINLPQRLDLMGEIMKSFVKIHSKCPQGSYVEKPATTPEEWKMGRDTGTSSLTIYSAITGKTSLHRTFDIPHDPDDFGRCYRLLKLFPLWREKLSETIKLCRKWKPFVAAWDELTLLYEEELTSMKAPKLYKRMKELAGDPSEGGAGAE